MKNSRKNLIMAVASTLLCVAPYSYAQTIDSETVDVKEFKLNSDTLLEENILSTKQEKVTGEYKLSLGSQMLTYQNPSRVYPSEAKHIDTGFKGVTTGSVDEVIVKDSPIFEIGSVITLNNSYEDNSIGFNESNVTGISFTTKAGRLDLHGSYNKTNMPMSIAKADSNAATNEITASARASIGSEESQISGSAKESIEASLASDYYLEAVYNFKPTLKGKVAFKKSMIDTFESKENVELEGIVEATSDVSIKAGYSEENRPEIETKNSKEKKVWTEFILKF